MGDAVSHAAGLKVASVVENKFTSALLHGLKAAVCHRLVRDCFREGNLYKGEELKDYFFPHFCGFHGCLLLLLIYHSAKMSG